MGPADRAGREVGAAGPARLLLRCAGAVPDIPVRTAVTCAAASYAANVALGLSVAVGAVDTSGARWVHHGLYIATATTTVLAIVAGATRRDPSALALGPAVWPLFLLQRHGSRPLSRHARTAMLATPCYAGALFLARR